MLASENTTLPTSSVFSWLSLSFMTPSTPKILACRNKVSTRSITTSPLPRLVASLSYPTTTTTTPPFISQWSLSMKPPTMTKRLNPNASYTLTPKIFNWNQQRQKVLKRNSDNISLIGPNKPQVPLVIDSSPKSWENQIKNHYLVKSIKNKIHYCRVHAIEIFYNMSLLMLRL